MMHGLGVISNWDMPKPDMFLPSSFKGSLNISGLGSSFIFDKFLMEISTGTWLNEYAKIITKEANDLSIKSNTNNEDLWYANFAETEGGKLASKLSKNIATNPRSVVTWYSDSKSNQIVPVFFLSYFKII